jgi:alpha-ketoglutarate-dependent taurine dioxygenase
MDIPVISGPGDVTALEQWLTEEAGRLRSSAAERGALVITGLGELDPATFERLAPRLLGGHPLDYSGGDSPRELLADGVYTSTSLPAHQTLPLHNELSYSGRYPSRLMFGCQTPAVNGGSTPLCDGRQLLERIPEQFLVKAVECGLTYTQRLRTGAGYGKSWMETFESDDRDQVESWLSARGVTYRWLGDVLEVAETVQPVVMHPETGESAWFAQVDQWHPSSLDPEIREILEETGYAYHDVTYGDGSPIADGDARGLGDIGSELSWSRPWASGDLMLVDNLVTLHGREPFDGSPRKILVSML